MQYEANRLTFLPHEISMLSNADSRRGQHATSLSLRRVFNSVISNDTLRRHSGMDIPDPDSLVHLSGEDIREVPKTLAELAKEELAHEQNMHVKYPRVHSEGALAVRRQLLEDLDALVANPRRVVLEVFCADYPPIDEKPLVSANS